MRGGSALDEAHPEVERWWATDKRAARGAPIPEGQRSVDFMFHGTMVVKYCAPRGTDEQTPIPGASCTPWRGSGTFVNGERRHSFAAGDVLFVPAGVSHRFADLTDDFGTWVIFYGPEGGERSGSV